MLEEGISVVLPAYCEAENLKIILPQIKQVLQQLSLNYEIVVVDTISPMDDTENVCRQLENCSYVRRENGNHYGDAIRTGIKIAKYSKIVIMDADGSHNCEDIAKLCEKFNTGYDVVIGSRYVAGGNSANSFVLQIMSQFLNCLYRLLFHLNIKDVSNSFRIYDAEKLKSIKIECDNYDLVEEILIKLLYKYNAIKIAEIPIFFDKRCKGESKRLLIPFLLSYIKSVKNLWKYRRYRGQ